MLITIVIVCIVVINLLAAAVLFRDLYRQREQVRKEPGRAPVQAIYIAVTTFLGMFGISDYAINTVVYLKAGWVEIKKLPGTLNAASTIPTMIAACAYIMGVEIQASLLISYIIAQTLGTLIGVRIVKNINARLLQKILACSLIIAGLFILMNKCKLLDLGGNATTVSLGKLIFMTAFSFVLGILKCVGVGTFPFTMPMVFFMGLNPLLAYPLMMGAGAVSSPAAAVQFIHMGAYSRRLTFLSSTVGIVSAVVAVFFVKSLNVSALQWIVLVVVFYAAITMLLPKKAQQQGTPTASS